LSSCRCGHGGVIWITGLARVGKTTTANALVQAMASSGIRPVFLDGDVLRSSFAIHDYDLDTRRRLAFGYARLAREISSQGFCVIVATISMFHDVQAWNRAHVTDYLEVLLEAPIDELSKRAGGELYLGAPGAPVVGRELAVEWPMMPDLRVRTGGEMTPARTAELILSSLGVTMPNCVLS
jgi:cytidine diphosphoramidate kinase